MEFIINIGDWERKGHENFETFIIESNKSSITDAEEKGKLIFNLEEICNRYGIDFVSGSKNIIQISYLMNKYFPENTMTVENVQSKDSFIGPVSIIRFNTPKDMAMFWCATLMEADETLKLSVREVSTHIVHIGYGLC